MSKISAMLGSSLRKVFHGAWLVLGLAQLAALSGCSVSDAGDSLLSTEISPSQSTGRSFEGGPEYVRVPRGFFAQPLKADLSVTDSSGAVQLHRGSEADWKETPLPLPPGPAPAAGNTPIAEFHDSRGCVTASENGDPGVCFQVMGDVDSVGLNRREMQPQGLAAWLDAQALPGSDGGCGESWTLVLTASAREADEFSVTYEASRCGGARYLIQLIVKSL